MSDTWAGTLVTSAAAASPPCKHIFVSRGNIVGVISFHKHRSLLQKRHVQVSVISSNSSGDEAAMHMSVDRLKGFVVGGEKNTASHS